MNILEKEIETLIYESHIIDPNSLRERGLDIYGHILRQVNLGVYGVADIIAFDWVQRSSWGRNCLNIQIIELKKDVVDVNSLMQAGRYAVGVERFLSKGFNLSNTDIDISIILIGKTIQLSGDFVFLLSSLPNVSAYEYRLCMKKGITFSGGNSWVKRDEDVVAMKEAIMPLVKDIVKYRKENHG